MDKRFPRGLKFLGAHLWPKWESRTSLDRHSPLPTKIMTTKGQQFLAIGDKRPILHSGMRGSLTSIAAVFFVSFAHSPQTFASDLNPDSPLVNAKRAVVSNYVVLVSATYQDSVNAAKKLQ